MSHIRTKKIKNNKDIINSRNLKEIIFTGIIYLFIYLEYKYGNR